MFDIQEIDKAIGAHGMWKGRLCLAIESGKLDTSVEAIRADNRCAFGKWIYGPTLSSQDLASSHYKTVKELHAEFHKIAAHVAERALSGDRGAAEKMMELNGEYAKISARLTSAMMAWKKAIKQ